MPQGGVALLPGEAIGQNPGILQRHVRPLRQKGQRRMRGVTQQRHTPLLPLRRHRMAMQAPERHLFHR